MKNIDDILSEVEYEAKLLTDTDDCFGIRLGDNKGLFIQVVDYDEGLEYLIELNDVDSGGAFEPCCDYNDSCEFGNIEKLKETIVGYLKSNKLLEVV